MERNFTGDTMTTRQLFLLRHAKTEAGTPAAGDESRELTPRGIAQAEALGEHFHEQDIRFDHVLCSSATRTRQTLQHIEKTYGSELPVTYMDTLYHASAGTMTDIIRSVPMSVKNLLVIGHNPGMHQLAAQLAVEGDEELIQQMTLQFPPLSLATYGCDITQWKELSSYSVTLKDFLTPDTLARAGLSSVA